MAKFFHLLLVAAVAVAGADDKGVPSTNKIEAAARSGNWDEFSNLISENVAQHITASKLSMPLIPFMPPIPPILPIPPIPPIPPILPMLPIPPMPNVFPPFPKITSFKESIPFLPPIPMPNMTFPAFPKLTSFKESKGSVVPPMPGSPNFTFPKLTSFKELKPAKSEPVTKFSSVMVSTSNSTTIDANGNVISSMSGTSVFSNNNEVEEFHVGNDSPLMKKFPPMEMQPMPTPAPNPKMQSSSSFHDFRKTETKTNNVLITSTVIDEHGNIIKNHAFPTTEDTNKTTSIQTTFYLICLSIIITLWNDLY